MEEMDWSSHDLLRELGMNRTYVGYQYLVYILELVRKEPERLERPTKRIYPDVSRAFQVEAGQVDSALRTAARVCWQFDCSGTFTHPDGRDRPPTVSRFLRLLAQEDRRRGDETDQR
jgi:hypothetical protein